MSRFLFFLAVFGILVSLPGCAVLLTGYLVGKGISDSKREGECRANLKIQNEDRAKRGLDQFPDMCGR